MRAAPQDTYWFDPPQAALAMLRDEPHYGGIRMRCFAQRVTSIDAMLRATVARRPDHVALVGAGLRIRYSELDQRVDAAAAAMQRHGIARGDRVVLLLGNRPEFLVLVLACVRVGAISVPVGTRQVREELRHVIHDCTAAAVFHDVDLAPAIPLATDMPSVRVLVALDGADGGPAFDDYRQPATPTPGVAAAEEDIAVLLYTSGTTGRPKGAMLTHLGLVHSVMHFAICYRLGDDTRTMLAVPASHVTGLVSLLLTTVYVGGTSILMPAFKAREFLALAERERMTYTLMVPAMYMLCLRDEAFARYRLDAWRVGGFGGSPMPQVTIAQIAEKLPGLCLQNAYGATETTSPTTLMPVGLALDHLDSVGQVVPCGEVRIVDASGDECASGESGEIWVRGPMVVPGYWGNPEANARGFHDGFWKSGDVGSKDAQGFVRVLDRLKDMLNRGGLKIFSAEVENVLAQHPHVVESAVVGVPCPVLHERVRAVVVTHSASTTVETLRAFCAERLADYKVPEFIDLQREPLPRNANGKIQKNQLRASPTASG